MSYQLLRVATRSYRDNWESRLLISRHPPLASIILGFVILSEGRKLHVRSCTRGGMLSDVKFILDKCRGCVEGSE
jgi:hypothetical protein